MLATFILASLACFRLALMLTQEDGPAWIFRKLRNAPPKRSSIHKGIRCPWCGSVWTAALVTFVLYLMGEVQAQWLFVYWMAVSGAAIGWNQWLVVRFK